VESWVGTILLILLSLALRLVSRADLIYRKSRSVVLRVRPDCFFVWTVPVLRYFFKIESTVDRGRWESRATANTKDPLAAIPTTSALFSVVRCCLPLLRAILEHQNPHKSHFQLDQSRVKGI
jgi:hypothetical protein